MTSTDLRERVAAIATMAALKGVTPPAYATPEGFALHASSIGHKFGFNDGDTPDPVWDLLHAYGTKVPLGIGGWWRGVLWDLVILHLVPAIEAHTGGPLPPLHFMEWTNHNPVRFADDDINPDIDAATLPDLTVHVPWLNVLAHAVIAVEAAITAKEH